MVVKLLVSALQVSFLVVVVSGHSVALVDLADVVQQVVTGASVREVAHVGQSYSVVIEIRIGLVGF